MISQVQSYCLTLDINLKNDAVMILMSDTLRARAKIQVIMSIILLTFGLISTNIFAYRQQIMGIIIFNSLLLIGICMLVIASNSLGLMGLAVSFCRRETDAAVVGDDSQLP